MKQEPKSRQHHKNNQAHKRAAKKTHAVRQHKRGVKQMAHKKQLQNMKQMSQQSAPLGLTMSGARHKQQNMSSQGVLVNSSAIRRFADQSKNNNNNDDNNNNSTQDNNNNNNNTEETEGTAREQLKKLGAKGFVKKFGKSFVYSYLGIYVGFLGALTGAFSVIPGLDAQSAIDWAMSTGHIDRPVAAFNSFLDSVPAIGEPIRNNKKFFSNFAAAWCVTKFTEPIRLPLAAALTLKVHAKLNPQAEASRDSAV